MRAREVQLRKLFRPLSNGSYPLIMRLQQLRWYSSIKKLLPLTLLILSVGCSLNSRSTTAVSPFPVREIKLPFKQASSVAWLENALIVEVSGEHSYDATLWRIPHDDPEEIHQLELPPHPSCGPNGLNGFKAPERLPDGSLSYIIDCRPRGQNVSESHMHLMVLDPSSWDSRQFLPYELPGPLLPHVSWKSDLSEGIAVKTNYLNSWVFRVTVEDWHPLDFGSSQIRAVAWSPDDDSIAFLAAPEQGLDGLNLVHAFFNLYLMEPDGGNLRSVVERIQRPHGLLWSADGRWLLFKGTIRRSTGIWAYNVLNGERVLITDTPGSLSGWLPDGRHFLVWNRQEGETPLEGPVTLSIYDLQPLLEERGPS